MDGELRETSPVTEQSTSKAGLWAGRIISALMVLFLLFDGTIHVLKIEPVVKAFGELGLPLSISVPLGIVELLCVVLYVIPLTSVLGAVLLTGYLGGAIAIQLRIGSPLFSNALFPVYIGVLLWLGLLLRDRGVRRFLPFRGQP
jgi:DoxX-like family